MPNYIRKVPDSLLVLLNNANTLMGCIRYCFNDMGIMWIILITVRIGCDVTNLDIIKMFGIVGAVCGPSFFFFAEVIHIQGCS